MDNHASLYIKRFSAKSQEEQNAMALEEHKAFAREWTKERPLLAPASLAIAIPAYTLAKTLGIVRARTPGSIAEMAAGYKGIYEGLFAE